MLSNTRVTRAAGMLTAASIHLPALNNAMHLEPRALDTMEARASSRAEPPRDASTGADPHRARWYVVQTRPNSEQRAIFNLERQGYRVFCPRMSRTVRHARKSRRVLSPLFPGYVFVRLDVSCEPWRRINGTFGVAHLIMRGETPQPVPPGIVEAIAARVSAEGVVPWQEPFKIGEFLRIADGPFADFVGVLQHIDAAGRVRVLLDLLGRSVSVAVRHESVMPAT